MRHVGTLQMARLLDAAEYYEKCGFKFVDVPWCVSRDAVLMTRPPWVEGEPFSYEAGGKRLYPVASAEQSFLQMQMDAMEGRRIEYGSYCAITPCFRNEPVLDDLHQPHFMKLELIRTRRRPRT
jgi:seryl-tRNA synthetase